jgi:hypothetical protein
MKKTLNIDDKLFAEAKAACGAATDTETVRSAWRHWCVTLLTSVCGLLREPSRMPRTFPGGVSRMRLNVHRLDGLA